METNGLIDLLMDLFARRNVVRLLCCPIGLPAALVRALRVDENVARAYWWSLAV